MNLDWEVGHVVRILFINIRRCMESRRAPEDGLTPMQGHILGYMAHHDEVYQRDLEREFEVRRSTASAIVQVMERDGLVTREPVASDARLKRLVMTDRARKHCENFHQQIEEIEQVMRRDVSQEELDAFFAVTMKFLDNLNEYANGGKEQDDHQTLVSMRERV